ncbi:BLUF domain-containing protein [Hymenobacter siberiensis]|uniref:BLUF domain-containing protein n=1 Tax=Hymenobacter siberiensis TaxID=2848396 RepID=UPI001C1E198B|nr:BLUF domain-containing protein [Hymenobacter siberiensis]
MNDAFLITESQRRRAVDWAVAITANATLSPQRYERQLLARYQLGDLTIDQVIELLDISVYQMLYRSRATAPLSDEALGQLLHTARRFNAEHRISDILLYSAGHFVQVLEGSEEAVRNLYAAIQQDTRHTQVVTVSAGPTAERHFAGWSMAFGRVATPDLDRTLRAPLLPAPPAPARVGKKAKTKPCPPGRTPPVFNPTPLSTYTLSYRPDLDIVFLRWLSPDTLAEAQASYEATLVLALAHGCGNWLLDSRRSGPLKLAETAWLTHDFFSVAVAQLAPRRLRLAVFSSMQRLEQMRHDAEVVPAVQAALAATQPYEAAIFMGEAEAVTWLQDPAA